jgi:hypothetical protein
MEQKVPSHKYSCVTALFDSASRNLSSKDVFRKKTLNDSITGKSGKVLLQLDNTLIYFIYFDELA